MGCQVNQSDVTLLPPRQMNAAACGGPSPIPQRTLSSKGWRLLFSMAAHLLCAGHGADCLGVEIVRSCYDHPMRIGFEHSYAALPPRFYAHVNPTSVNNPQLVLFNRRLAEELALEPDLIEREAAAMLSGN